VIIPGMPLSVNMEEVIASSFKDFHTKGFDYICLSRSDDLTVKLYLMDGVVTRASEVVNPHDHRYAFETFCLSGKVTNYEFVPGQRGKLYERFDYLTPLNGGAGFSHAGQVRLERDAGTPYLPGESYRMEAAQLHTIRVHGGQTALLLLQHRDVVPVGQPTQTFCLDREPPSLSGLYQRFTADEVIDRLRKLEKVSGIKIAVD
jgi:hypothetical protein